MGEKRYCEKCGKILSEVSFYMARNKEAHPPDGRLNICKKCLTMHIDYWDPETYMWVLQELDVPYVKRVWDEVLTEGLRTGDPNKFTGAAPLGKYLSHMKLVQWRNYSFEDTDVIAKAEEESLRKAMASSGKTSAEIDAMLEQREQSTPEKPIAILENFRANDLTKPTILPNPEDFHDEYSDKLTDEDKAALRLKWGKGYTCEQWVKMEQLYNDFESSYDIQTAGHRDTLIMVCKASLKANELMDAGQLDDAQKMTRVYDSLMKSGNFTAAQNKTVISEGIDSVGELVLMAEKEGFIPRYYVGSPKDSVDQILADLQHYTRQLVCNELNLGDMIEAAVVAIQQDKERENKFIIDTSSEDKIVVDNYHDAEEMTDQEYEDFVERQMQLQQEDKEALENGS